MLVLIVNAVNVGLDAGFLFGYGKGGLFFTLILPHGMLELSAVFLAAAAGLRLGWTHDRSRPAHPGDGPGRGGPVGR